MSYIFNPQTLSWESYLLDSTFLIQLNLNATRLINIILSGIAQPSSVLPSPPLRVHLHGGDHSSNADRHTVRRSPHGQLWPELLQELHSEVLGQRWVGATRWNPSCVGAPGFLQPASVCLLRSGNLFVVQWDKVRLKDREAEGPFTFQAALHKNGTIVFNYRDVSDGFQLNCLLHHLYLIY